MIYCKKGNSYIVEFLTFLGDAIKYTEEEKAKIKDLLINCWTDHRKAKKMECENVLKEVESLGKRISDWKKIKWQVETIKIQEERDKKGNKTKKNK